MFLTSKFQYNKIKKQMRIIFLIFIYFYFYNLKNNRIRIKLQYPIYLYRISTTIKQYLLSKTMLCLYLFLFNQIIQQIQIYTISIIHFIVFSISKQQILIIWINKYETYIAFVFLIKQNHYYQIQIKIK
ncbi:unnamed protein product (macronuclear) [Paramecium tetraurelia]|uniref:Transmembrane protein n=1 Tax=Paramecium tetraurelia TaxID=5888 RepID=A0BJF0_PARTE|nr:uncharacterized protein GSPATT00029294001 [Paramecium tetraurelia]CAK58667.1 unnamed protein product [Paramecium tetraurelia]|eukprot:XP_001426065.1 hypothetical protein (macronuclear) [Paramecium tetraurelia strain d4-2]